MKAQRPYAVTTGVVVRSRRPTDRDDVQDPHERGRSAAAPESAPADCRVGRTECTPGPPCPRPPHRRRLQVLDAEHQLKLIDEYGGIEALGGDHTAPHFAPPGRTRTTPRSSGASRWPATSAATATRW